MFLLNSHPLNGLKVTVLTTLLASSGTLYATQPQDIDSPLAKKISVLKSDEYPVYQDFEYVSRWQEHYASNPIDFPSWPTDQQQQYRDNQRDIMQLFDMTRTHLRVNQSDYHRDLERAQNNHSHLKERYESCAAEQSSWSDLAAGIAGVYGFISAITGHPLRALVSVGCSGGIYYLSGIMQEMELQRLKAAMKNNDIAFDELDKELNSGHHRLQEAGKALLQSRHKIQHNLALLTGGRLLQDQDREASVNKLYTNSSYRHMQMPLEFNARLMKSEMYGILASNIEDDVFIVSLLGEQKRPDSRNTYKLIRSNNNYYLAIPSANKQQFLEFDSVTEVLNFLSHQIVLNQASRFGFINLDPLPINGVN